MRPTPTTTAGEATLGVTLAAAGRPDGRPATRTWLLLGDEPVDYVRHVEGTTDEVLVIGSVSEHYRVAAGELTVRVR